MAASSSSSSPSPSMYHPPPSLCSPLSSAASCLTKEWQLQAAGADGESVVPFLEITLPPDDVYQDVSLKTCFVSLFNQKNVVNCFYVKFIHVLLLFRAGFYYWQAMMLLYPRKGGFGWTCW